MTQRYDVFITCKSEDYKYAEVIYDFLSENGVSAFLASKELRRLGESEYRKAISNAMQQAYHLIIFASKAEYIDSTWVYYEWDMFVNAKLKGYKPGNIITILKDIKTDEINMDLWKYESLRFESYADTLLRYVETPQALERRKRMQQERAEADAERRRREQEERKVRVLKDELVKSAEDYQKKRAALSVDVAKIRSLLASLHVVRVSCPVCGTDCKTDGDFCRVCGWQLSPVSGVDDIKYLDKVDPERLALHQRLYKDSLTTDKDGRMASENRHLTERIRELEGHLAAANNRAETYQRDNVRLKSTIGQLERRLAGQLVDPVDGAGGVPPFLRWLFPDWQHRTILRMVLLTMLAAVLVLFVIWSLAMAFNGFPCDVELLVWTMCGVDLLATIYLLGRRENLPLYIASAVILLLCGVEMILFDETLTLITLIAGYLCLGSIVVLGISDRPAVQRVSDTRALAVDGGDCALIVVSMLLISWIAIPYWIAAAISKITKPGFWNWSIRHTKQLWIMVGVMFLLQLTIVGLCYQKESYWNDYYRYDYPAYDAVDSVAVDVEETTVDSVASWSAYYYDTYPDTAAYKY